MKIINPIPFKIIRLLLIFTLLQENSNAQTCGSCAVPDCIGVKQYLNKPAAQAGTSKVFKNYVPTLTRTTGTFTTYATIRTDANGQVGVMQEIQISGATAQISVQMQAVLASRTYLLYALTDAACATPLIANIGNDGCSQTFNPAWTNLQPNTNYKIAITTNLGVLSAGYEYKGFNIRYYHAVRPASQFTFNCGAATTVGNFYANGINGQSGTLRLPITGATSGTATFSVTGSGFTGAASVNIGAGQTWVSIPIRYDGTGAIGNRTLTVTSLRGTGSCAPVVNVKPSLSTFSFNCASASSTGSFLANHTGNQSGSLTIPLSNATAGQATFSVSGGGFSGMLATTLTAGQLSVSIPIVYDGTGVSGNHAVTVISPQGIGGCGLNINVLAPMSHFTFNCGGASATGHFVLNNVANQGGFVTIPMTGATAGTAVFMVVGTGFTGGLITQLVDNQTLITIPITYDGGGVVGFRPLTILSPQGIGNCSVQAEVVSPSVAGAVTFNCPANVTPIGSFVANGISGQKGMITIDFATQLAGEVTFSVSNNGFTGSLTTQVAAGQTKANILVNYDGSGAAGNHAVTVISSEATGSCTTNIAVQAIFDFSCAVYNTNSNFTSNGTSQNGTLVIPLSNVSEGNATFTVSNNGFTGSLTTILRDSQRFVAIPVIYDGSGAFGNHAVTVASTQGSGTCLANVLVKNPNLKGCDFIQGQNVTFNIHSQNKNNGFITEYILTDSAGVIKYHTLNQPFTNVEVGEYEGYAVNYQGVPIPNLAIGTQLNAIGGNCVSLSNALPIKVCTSFQFLGNGDVTGTFISNGNGGQTGILYIPLDNGMDAPIDFNVAGNGFTGNMTFTPDTEQDTLAIPITYDGSGTGGMMPIEINGVGGGNTGIMGIWVMSPPPATPFAFDCGSSVLSGTFVANQTTQSGSITVNISGITATSTTDFTVTGTNFSGGLINAELTAGQTSISIPIDYNGATPAGNYNITIGSPHGSNTCTIVVPVTCIAPILTSLVKTNPTVASCPALNNGEIVLNVSGSNLRYSKNNGLTWQDSTRFGQLTAGTRVIRIQDSLSGCYVDTTIVLIAPNPNCNGFAEICNNGLDDDGDGKIDEEDSDCTPLACNNTSGNITFNGTGQNVTADYTQQYVLTDTTGLIKQIASNPSFSNVLVGQYRVYGLNYRTADGISGLTVGATWAGVTGTCFQKSPALLFKVCPPPPVAEICNNGLDDDGDGKIDGEDSDCTPLACNNTSGTLTFSITGQNTAADNTQRYVLTDTLGVINQISSNTSFLNVAVGQYRVYGLNYRTTDSITGLTIGANWNAVTGVCFQKSPALLFKVCAVPLFAINCGASVLNGTFVANQTTQTGSITLTLTGVTAMTTDFTVTGTNFSGGLNNVSLTAGQTSLSIPISYNGFTPIGNYNIVLNSPKSSNPCTIVIPVNCVVPAVTSVSKTNPTCPTVNNGQITVNATGLRLRYSKDNGVNWQVSNLFNGLMAGNQMIRIQDSLTNCFKDTTVVLATPNCTEICNNGLDDDGDGKIDGEDDDCTPLACNATGNNIYFNITNQNVTADYTQRYVLTDTAMIIKQISLNTSFTNVSIGSYRVYGLNYKTADGITGLAIGSNWNAVTGNCYEKTAKALLYKICPIAEICNNGLDDDGDGKIDGEDSDCTPLACNNTSGRIIFNVTGQNVTADYTQKYVLTDTLGVIKQIASNTIFNNVSVGQYRVFGINYKTSSSITGLTVGANWNGVTGSCYQKSPALLFKVCTAIEICNNGLDDDNDGLIDEEDADCGVMACNNTTGTITFTIAGQRTDSTFKQKYLLTNVLGTIQKVDVLSQFNNLATGQYRVYGINYDSTLVVTGMVVGQNIANLSNNYYQKSLPLLFKVCITNESICNDGIDNDGDGLIDNEDPDCPALACTDTLSNIFVTFSDTVPTNYTRRYALTNQGGLILQVASTAQFGNLVSGSYRIYCVTYSSAAGITHLTPGDSILKVTSSDFIVSAPVLRKVCLNVTNEICNNLMDDDGDGKIDCEDSDCVTCGCNNYSGTLTFNVPVSNPSANHTRRYILTNNTGVILQVSSNPVFTDWASGEYRAYTFFYDPAQFTPSFGIGSSIFAQTGAGTSFVLAQLFKVCRPDSKFEVQIVIKSYNCATKKAQLQVQVKTQDGTSPFLMGDGNFRIDYNVLQMHTPVLVNQDNFSNRAAAMDLNYNPQTLTGSSEGATNGRISLNVSYSGANNGGKLVPNVWTTVSTLEMTATDTATRLQMAWRTNLVFPATGLTGVVLRDTAGNYETFEVTSGAVFIPLNYGIENYCNCTALDVKVLLEGPMNVNTSLMGTILNQRGLLPGQIPIGLFGIPTPTGQPYNTAPWYYTGNEAITHYDSTVVDWVLVTVRSDSASADSVVARKAGLLHQDGHVDFVDNCWSLPFNKRYFVVIEHRNHMGVMSPSGQLLSRGGVIRHDFTQFNGYIVVNPNSTGQKLIGGKWTMLACDGKKNTYTNNFDINFLDAQYWKAQSGIFDAYRDSDFNLDADVNFFDSLLWKRNNGQYSGVPHR
jgi:hypothetical protein